SRRTPSAVHSSPASSTSSAQVPGASRDARSVSASLDGIAVGSCIVIPAILHGLVGTAGRRDPARGESRLPAKCPATYVSIGPQGAILDRIAPARIPPCAAGPRPSGYDAPPELRPAPAPPCPAPRPPCLPSPSPRPS